MFWARNKSLFWPSLLKTVHSPHFSRRGRLVASLRYRRPYGFKCTESAPLRMSIILKVHLARVAQWREYSPPTNVALVQIPASTPYVGWACLLLVLSFAPRGFSLRTPVFPSPQKPTLPNSNSIWNARTRLNEFSRTLKYFLAKRITITLFYQIYLGVRGDGLARLPPSTAINPRAHPSVLLKQRWPPLTESARFRRRSYEK